MSKTVGIFALVAACDVLLFFAVYDAVLIAAVPAALRTLPPIAWYPTALGAWTCAVIAINLLGLASIHHAGKTPVPVRRDAMVDGRFVHAGMTSAALTGRSDDNAGTAGSETTERLARFVGKWVVMDGRLDFAETGLLRGMVTLAPPAAGGNPLLQGRYANICFWFQREWFSQIEALRPGDRVQLVGRIAAISPFFVDVCNCALLPQEDDREASSREHGEVLLFEDARRRRGLCVAPV